MEYDHDHTFRLSNPPCVTIHKDGELTIHDHDYSNGCGFSIYLSQEIAKILIAEIQAKIEGGGE